MSCFDILEAGEDGATYDFFEAGATDWLFTYALEPTIGSIVILSPTWLDDYEKLSP